MVQASVWLVFTDSCVDLTEVAGRHGIEIADQASCASGWNLLSSSGRHRFWHIHCILTPKLIVYSFLVAVQQWLSMSNPSELSLQPRLRSARDQLRLDLSGVRRDEHVGQTPVDAPLIHHHCQCQFRPLHIHKTLLRQFDRSVNLWKILKMRKRK